MPGPQEQRLIKALQGADGGRAFTQSRGWSTVRKLLADVADALDSVDPPSHGGEAGALTADAMKNAFAKSAAAMRKRTTHLSLGEVALVDAGGAIETADAEFQALGPEGSAPTHTPHPDPGSEEGIKAQNKYLADLHAFEAQQAQREEAARKAADKLEAELDKAADVMAKLHDRHVRDEQGTGGGGGYPAGAASGGGAGSAARGGGGSAFVLTAGPDRTPDDGPRGPRDPDGGPRDPGGPRIDYVPGSPNPHPGGTPAEIGSGSTVPVAGVGSGSGGGLNLGPAGVVAGGAAAGIIGAKLGGALRGVLAGGAGAAGSGAGVAGRSSGTAASAVRGIGATAKSAGASTLGRSATSAAAGRAAAGGGTAGRPGTAGNGAGRAGSRAGAPGAGRGAGHGAGRGGGRGGRGGKDQDGLDHERFDVGEDWVGDDDAGPGVLS